MSTLLHKAWDKPNSFQLFHDKKYLDTQYTIEKLLNEPLENLTPKSL